MYDWANSAFQSTIITAVFPDFFASVAAADLPREGRERSEHVPFPAALGAAARQFGPRDRRNFSVDSCTRSISGSSSSARSASARSS